MKKNNFCLRCLLRDCGREDTLKSIKEHIKKIADRDKAGDAEYKRRVALCAECESLSEGTCLKCGCYPEFKAAFIKQSCPEKKW